MDMQRALSYTPVKPVSAWPWFMLVGRTILFVGVQALFALGFFAAGSDAAWTASVNWWPLVVGISNIVCVLALVVLFRAEGENYWDVFRIRREHVKGDLLALLGSLVIAGPAGFLPNILLANWLFDDSQTVLELFVRPLPVWAVYTSLVLFPVTQGLAELATYFAYVMPRLESQGQPRWLAVALPALMLGLQHAAAPLVFDVRFITWRALMFVPFAIVTGIILRWRPRLLPYMAVTHVLMNLSVAVMFLEVAY
jgi:hypothetical protein